MNFFSNFWAGLKALWTKFDGWCARRAPGIKTYLLAFLGLLGTAGGSLQEYFTNVPLTTFVTAQEATYISAALFALIIFTRHLTNTASNAVSNS